MTAVWEALRDLWDLLASALAIGERSHEIGAGAMAARAAIVYSAAIVMVRLAHARFRSGTTPLDLVVAIMIGSVLSRGITGQAPMGPTIAGGAALLAAHWLLAELSCRQPWLGRLLKGRGRDLVIDGECCRDEMRRAAITDNDLEVALHSAGVSDVRHVRLARLERSGSISVIRRQTRKEKPEESSATEARRHGERTKEAPRSPNRPPERAPDRSV